MSAEVVPGLYQVPACAGSFLWRPLPADAGPSILFDCGCPWSGRQLVAGLVALGCPPEELDYIAITHDDIDHAGRLGPLWAVSGAQVIAGALEAPRLASERWRDPPVLQGPGRFLLALLNRLYGRMPHHAVVVAMPVEDGDALPGGWVAVHTPGHTPGHTSYFHPERRILVAGDAFAHSGGGRFKFPMAIYTEDMAQAGQSIRKLAALEPEVIVFGHGPALHGAAGLLREYAEGLP